MGRNRGSSVCIATGYGLDSRQEQVIVVVFRATLGVHVGSYPVGTRGSRRQDVKLTTSSPFIAEASNNGTGVVLNYSQGQICLYILYSAVTFIRSECVFYKLCHQSVEQRQVYALIPRDTSHSA